MMALSKPRIYPLKESEWGKEIKEALRSVPVGEGEQIPNIFTTLSRHVKLLKSTLASGRHVMVESTLPPRDREILILRIGWLCRSEYEWGQHVVRGRIAGLPEEEILRIRKGSDAKEWDPFDAALLHAVDELHADAFISDTTWDTLARRYDTRQLMDLIFTVGQYNMVSMILNSLGVQLDEELEGFPKP
jgi:alkylhydroperoxidase family enzyme